MLRLLIRILGLLALAGAFVMAVIDGTRSIGARDLLLTSLRTILEQLPGGRYALIQPSIERNISPLLWDPVLVSLLPLPAFLFLALTGFCLVILAGSKRKAIGFSSRP